MRCRRLGAQCYQHHSVGDLPDEDLGRIDPGTIVELIFAKLRQPLFRFTGGDTIQPADPQFLEDFLERQCMSGFRQWLVGLPGGMVGEELLNLVAAHVVLRRGRRPESACIWRMMVTFCPGRQKKDQLQVQSGTGSQIETEREGGTNGH